MLLRDDVKQLGALVGEILAEQESPDFLAQVEVLAKSDMAIFERYSLLAGNTHTHYYTIIFDEFMRCQNAILSIKHQTSLLQNDQRLAQSIRLRNPYVDPISLLQVDLLARWRTADRPEDALFNALVATVNGIAAGVQNTG